MYGPIISRRPFVTVYAANADAKYRGTPAIDKHGNQWLLTGPSCEPRWRLIGKRYSTETGFIRMEQ